MPDRLFDRQPSPQPNEAGKEYESMAKTVNVVVTDDLDGSTGAEAVNFTFDGHGYEIDLGPGNRTRLADTLRPYIEAARRTNGRKPTRNAPAKADRTDRTAIRAWASAQGLQIADRGRISADIIRQYDAAH
jgi:hypothetical protein